ncbi:arylesterase [Luteimonas dalianensis]|uniref:arylesterase n=1 Tax=Luteimonas dalianensis TaxID=1148196 RepID=UPI003BF0324B
MQWAIGPVLLLLCTLAQAQPAQQAGAPDDARRTLLVMGDSLSAGYGMAAEQGWVSLLADELGSSHPDWRVVNASISGETSAGGAARIIGEAWRNRPDVVVIALGANDGLRGLPLAEMRRNLARMIGVARHVDARVLLVGMQMPPNLGADYTRGFEGVYRDLSTLFDVPLVPFLLEPIALQADAYQADDLHPTAAVQPRIADHVRPALLPLLDREQ